MTRTYIYGIPRGFNFYEGEPELIDYFKSYYIADRRGKRLEIDRRENGETFYNYLRYGLAEVSRTPQNAFFGMTLVIGDGKYIADIKTLIEFMDLLFSKLVERGTLLAPDDNGILRYKIERFDRASDDVNWIKGNLPNILKRIGPQNYDDSFAQGETGKIATFKSDVSKGQVLAALRKYNRVSICANITEQDTTVGFEPEEEIDFIYLVSWLNNTNQKLVPIAISPTPDSLPQLHAWRDTATRHLESLVQQMDKLKKGVVYDNLNTLGKDLYRLRKQLDVLIKKLSLNEEQNHTPPHTPPEPITRNCLNCQRQLPESEFSSPSAIICRDCERKQKQENNGRNGTGRNLPSHRRANIPQWLLPCIAAIAIIIFGIIFLPKACSNEETGGGGSPTPVNKKVDQEDLAYALANRNFKEVYKLLDGKEDNTKYFGQVEDTIFSYMWSCVDNNQKKDIVQFWSKENFNLLKMLDFEQNKQTEWLDFCDDYHSIKTALSQSKIKQNEYDKLCGKIDKHESLISKKKAELPNEWKNNLKKKIDTAPQKGGQKKAKEFKVHYTNFRGKDMERTILNEFHDSPYRDNDIQDVKEDTEVTITAIGGVIDVGKYDGQSSVSIPVGKAGGKVDPVPCSDYVTIYLKAHKKHGQ